MSGRPKQHARHGNTHLPSAGERADVAVDSLVVEAEAVQHLARLSFEGVAAQVFVLFLHHAEARQDGVHVVGSRRIRHGVLECFELVVKISEASAAGDRFVEHRPPAHLLDVLPEIADGELSRNGDLPFIGRFFADDHAKQRRLAGAIGTDEPDLFSGIDLQRGVDEEDLPAVLLADVREGDHSSFYRPAFGLFATPQLDAV